jgi:two-component system catabolic regulation response regulator CreB
VIEILVIEDEVSIADTLLFVLESEGFAVAWVRLGQEGIERALSGTPALVILDVGLPDLSGFEVCKAIRRQSEVPILFLSARIDEIDRVVGLEIGADDYVTKPFSPREVAARVRTILKRARGNPTHIAEAQAARPKDGSEFLVDSEALRVSFLGAPLTLTAQEYRLLTHLVARPGRVLSRAQLLEAIGTGSDANYERNIDSHIKSLRSKLRAIDAQREPTQTHRGFGYSYEPSQE